MLYWPRGFTYYLQKCATLRRIFSICSPACFLPRYILAWGILYGLLDPLVGSVNNYTYFTVLTVESFDLFTAQDFNLCRKFYVDVESQYGSTI